MSVPWGDRGPNCFLGAFVAGLHSGPIKAKTNSEVPQRRDGSLRLFRGEECAVDGEGLLDHVFAAELLRHEGLGFQGHRVSER